MVSNIFFKQIKGLIKKTITIKKKKRVETMIEFLYGIQYIMILVILHQTTKSIQPHVIYGTTFNQSSLTTPMLIPFISFDNNSKLIIDRLTAEEPMYHFVEYENEQDLTELFINSDSSLSTNGSTITSIPIFTGVMFNEISLESSVFNYSLVSADIFSDLDSGYSLQLELDLLQSFTELKSGLVMNQNISVIEFPYESSFFNINTVLFIIYLPLFFMYSLQQLIMLIVTEKKERIKEAMKVMGLSEGAYWLSNIIVQITMNLILTILMEIIAYSTGIFTKTNPLMIFIMFLIFSLSLIGIAFLLATFIENPKTAGGVSSIFLLFGISVSAFYQFYIKSRVPSLKYLIFLLSPAAFGEFLNQLSTLESNNLPVTWSSNEFLIPLAFMVLDFILYSLISWYSIQFYQSEYGSSKSFFYFLKSSSSSSSSSSNNDEEKKSIINYQFNNNNEIIDNIGINIKNLKKEFKNSLDNNNNKNNNIIAVDNLTLEIKKDQIFALLGKNGAGKSTTIGMLTGLIPPSSGDATILGMSMTHQMDDIRKHIGLCSQENRLYQQLTCAEHIELFSRIKGLEEEDIPQQVLTSLEEVGLLDQRDQTSTVLSGGQKRRLCLAIAFIGNPDVVFLDECSSGLDVYARHQIWKLLEKKKVGKTIILTTHFMEEAEALAETIAIMTKGKLNCQGSVLELKSKFGLGYNLILTFDNSIGSSSSSSTSSPSGLKKITGIEKPFEKFLFEHFPDCLPMPTNRDLILANREDLELSYSLTQQDNADLSKFFSSLEQLEGEFHIKRISLQMKTLEEIFLKISEDQ
ncbi:ABC transporter A family protein [Tieghemostelium lacteum]|uniref:ABC transporter A family protein n=1 Tax=Tieghemostelium lacteum TaxID=361077 RepID=A0A151ZJC6_TIELA|nr:ABC transporter A family protein [Tieghemostelium lacteum]|eukprot:KYQ94015.1 ABC transporter A family protein [Tieghemostelium lacteum]